MTLSNGTTKLRVLVSVLLVATVFAAAAGAATDRSHPGVAAGAGCVTTQCHARLLAAAAGGQTGSVHQPAAAGGCDSCHDLALAAKARFVRGAPGGGAEGAEPTRAWDLTLCSGCHGEGLLAPGAPAPATGFAQGPRNLHALHVQAGRGRRCLTCHDPHASRQARLLRERLPARGGVQISQEFRGQPRGGWCKTGCHAPKSYTR